MQFLKKITTLLSIVFLAIQLQTVKAQTATDTKLEKTLLWKITGKGIKPSYIFGTVHMMPTKDYFWDKKMEKAFKKTKKLVTEIDMSEMMVVAMKMMQLSEMEGDTKLKNLVTAEEYEMIKLYFTEEAKSPELKVIPFDMIENWIPILTQTLLYTEMLEGDISSYETELTAKATKAKMSFGGLETIEDQLSALNKIPYKAQAKMLVEAVENLKKGENSENEFVKIIEIYKTQDIDGLVASTSDGLDEMEGQAALLDDRNANWIPLIKEMSKKDKVFYAVGAAHLGGAKGVIRLLRKAGLTVKPVLK